MKIVKLKRGKTNFEIEVPNDAKSFRTIQTDEDDIRIYFKTKFGGKKYLDTYTELNKNSINESLDAVSVSKIIYPTNVQIEKLLDKWCDRHEESWDYESDRENVRKTINECIRLIKRKNK